MLMGPRSKKNLPLGESNPGLSGIFRMKTEYRGRITGISFQGITLTTRLRGMVGAKGREVGACGL